MKAKKELVLTTYRDYVRHFGIKLGAKKWREHKEKKKKELKEHQNYNVKPIKITDTTNETAHKGYVGGLEPNLEPIQKAVIGGPNPDIRQTKADILECGASAVELIRLPIWHKWIKPHIQKDAIDFLMRATMSSGEKRDEAIGSYKYAQRIIRTIDKWIGDYTHLMTEMAEKQEKKEKEGK